MIQVREEKLLAQGQTARGPQLLSLLYIHRNLAWWAQSGTEAACLQQEEYCYSALDDCPEEIHAHW